MDSFQNLIWLLAELRIFLKKIINYKAEVGKLDCFAKKELRFKFFQKKNPPISRRTSFVFDSLFLFKERIHKFLSIENL